jgi:3-dehydroquinate synthase
MAKIQIRSSVGRYEVHCGEGMLARGGSLVVGLGESTGTFVLSSPRVWKWCGRRISDTFRGKQVRGVILFDDREANKRLATVEKIQRTLVRAGADRRCVLIAVGGGVVGDVAGFVAASYLRGVRLVHVPTTLLAQVDSSLGGKTGVDLPEGKNLVGAFYPPQVVIADSSLLETLPHRELRSGLYEVVKYGVIADRELFAYVQRHMPSLLRRDPKALSWVIERCIRIKARVVTKDEHEDGPRQILNFGHTLGHALETATGYKRFVHGEAIGWGMLAATMLGAATGRIDEREAARIIRLIASVGPLPSIAAIKASDLARIVAGDKKALRGKARWVLPVKIGKVVWGEEVPWKLAARAFGELLGILAKARE